MQELFDLEAFDNDPAPFWSFAHALWPGDTIQPSFTHRFLALLAEEKRLLRVYTQNIDGLERAAGIAPAKLVECHGCLATARCRSCRKTGTAAELTPAVKDRKVPRCRWYVAATASRIPYGSLPCSARVRAATEFSARRRSGGVWKPEVTFFGEALAPRVGRTLELDRAKADLLLVIGTSLAVAPISKVMGWLPAAIPQILVNRCDA
eukprot:COSAG05_NODE_2501_length_2977_cov_1.785268_3_plen_207_part_00